MTSRPKLRRSASAGFTLVELMLIVALVGILAVIAVSGYRYWMRTAKTGETKDLIQTIMLGQHTYHADTEGYLNCSSSWTDFYPIIAGPNDKKHLFHNPSHPDYDCWILLAPEAKAGGYASFTTRAGTQAEPPPQPPTAEQRQNWPPPTWTGPWYIVLATLDQDADLERGYMVGSSFEPNSIHMEKETE